jgi:hypothetical protein
MKLKDIVIGEFQELDEAISKEEWQGYVEYGKQLKTYLSSHDLRGLKLKVKVIKSTRPNPWIDVSLVNWKDETIPNEFRVKVAKSMSASGVRDWDNVQYGNIRPNSISLLHSQWKKLLHI